ncbi:MAG: ThaI family type II restriction endonuclease, partial [Terriglobia bacterium]
MPLQNPLLSLFDDPDLCDRIRRKLPELFQIAEIHTSRAGGTGMEAGTLREQILIALLVFKFGEENVKTEFPITHPETDVEVLGRNIAIKTKTGLDYSGVKVGWTVDRTKVLEFAAAYQPSADILLARIKWGHEGGLWLVTHEAQVEALEEMGHDDYLKLPTQATNPRGVELSTR